MRTSTTFQFLVASLLSCITVTNLVRRLLVLFCSTTLRSEGPENAPVLNWESRTRTADLELSDLKVTNEASGVEEMPIKNGISLLRISSNESKYYDACDVQ